MSQSGGGRGPPAPLVPPPMSFNIYTTSPELQLYLCTKMISCCDQKPYNLDLTADWVYAKAGLWTGLDYGLDSGLDSGLNVF